MSASGITSQGEDGGAQPSHDPSGENAPLIGRSSDGARSFVPSFADQGDIDTDEEKEMFHVSST